MTSSSNANSFTTSRFDLLRYRTELLMREQEFFWQRFYAFATLHAGTFVLMTSNRVPVRPLAWLGLALGIIWFYVQWASLHYANRWKDSVYNEWPNHGISYSTAGIFASSFGKLKSLSSTNAAFFVTWLVVGAWLVVLSTLPPSP